MISAIIPVRKGSIRVKNKNIRSFGDTNLLERKIKILKKVKGIDEIIVSSDCDKMLSVAEKLGVLTHTREKFYASSSCSAYQYYNYMAKNVGKYENLKQNNITIFHKIAI